MSDIPIIGQRAFQCVLCGSDIKKAPFPPPINALICMNEKCNRFGLLTLVAKDPALAEQQQRAIDEGEEGP